jgi:general secretion pathway protein D
MADRSRDTRAGGVRVVVRLFLALVVAGTVAGCSERQLAFPESSIFPSIPAKPPHTEAEPPPITRGTIEVAPVPRRPPVPAGRLQVEPFTLRLGNEPVSGSFDQMPLNAFINAVFGDLLKVSYQLDPALAQRTDIVTLRAEPQPPQRFLELVRQVLASYGIAVTERNGVLLVIPSASLAQQSPAIIRSRALADVPVGLRPVFQYVELLHTRPQTIATLLNEAFGQRVRVAQLPFSNAILLMGLPDDVRAVLGTVQLFDQPAFANRISIKMVPAYWTVERLGAKLTEILRTEGYDVSARLDPPGLIQMIPIEGINALIIFAPDQATLDHVLAWARELDQPSQVIGNNTIFYYAVRNTKAETIAPLLSIIDQGLGGPAAPIGAATTGGPAPAAGATSVGAPAAAGGIPIPGGGGGSVGAGSTAARSGAASQRVVVDTARNAIIFRGSAEEFSQIRALLESLDQPVREALIEVTVAEIRLTDTLNLGIEWALQRSGILDNNLVRLGTAGGLGIGSGGLNFAILNDAGQARLLLNTFARDDRFSILSSPRLLAKSGTEARIQVGSEVPILTSQQTAQTPIGGNPSIIQSIQYRSTGVLLTIRPVIHSGDRVDLEVSQEVSEATTNSTSQISSPIISNRKISTNLTLKDGTTVMLGGLISENRDLTQSGIPFLRDLPGVGQLFRVDSSSNRKTELIVLITPYIIDSDEQARAVTDAFRQRFPVVPR